jgi:serine/threonine protein kinase
MASVYLATSPSGATVVLKMPLNDDPDTCERMRDEARTGLRLGHPNIVETLDLFEFGERPVLVLSYVQGASMYELRCQGALAAPVVLRVGRQICEALDAIHHASDEHGRPLGILHRDVTAGNVMLAIDGEARLIDLGIARSSESQAARTRSGCMRGTLRYIAPELFEGSEFSAQSDLWSLGIVLFEAALGRTCFGSKSDAEVVLRIVEGSPLELRVGEWMDPRVRRALTGLLEKDPSRRPARARDAAALFAMLEKDFADSRVPAAYSVRSCLMAVKKKNKRDSTRVSTEVLVERASRTYGSAEIEILEAREDSSAWAAFDYEAETVADSGTFSEETERVGRDKQAQPPRPAARLEPTSCDRLDDARGMQVYDSPRDAILAYAQQLRSFELSGRMPKSESSGEVVVS